MLFFVTEMRNHILFIVLFLGGGLQGFAQKYLVDTVLDVGIYQSFFNYKLKEPLYVTYILFKGGGDCDREDEGFDFEPDDFESTATGADYARGGYDKGHLANAEDFAKNCEEEELTFRYYNCVPQTVKMNRGIWKSWETKLRKLSQQKKLFIVAGSIYGKKKLGENRIGVPSYCYKIVLEAKTKKILFCMLFPNDSSGIYQNITLKELKKKMGYDLMPAEYWQNN
jgi:endonuclease G